jgi:hypothetical protein
MMTIVAVKPAEIASDAINNVSKFTSPLTWLTFLKRHQRRAN